MIRRVSRVEYSSGEFLTIPSNRSVIESEQDIEGAVMALTGADYEYDILRRSRAPKRNGVERVSFLIVGQPEEINAKIDEMRARLYVGARFKLWTAGTLLDAYGAEYSDQRWADARISAMPGVHLTVDNRRHAPVTLIFERFSDWYGSDASESTFPLDNYEGESFTVLNEGTARVVNAEIVLRGVFDNPEITNLTNGYRLKSTREGSGPDDWLRFRANGGAGRVEFSDDGGATWTGDYGNFVRKTNQVALMVLDPGLNEFAVDGVADGAIDVSFYPAWH